QLRRSCASHSAALESLSTRNATFDFYEPYSLKIIANNFRCIVLRTIIYNDDFDVLVAAGTNRIKRPLNHNRFVMCWDHHAHKWAMRVCAAALRLAELLDVVGVGTNDEQTQMNHAYHIKCS